MSKMKRQVRSLLNRLPESATYEDLQYHLYVIQKIERSFAEADAGKTIPHEEVVRMTKQWAKGSYGRRPQPKILKASRSSSRATRSKTQRLRSSA